PMHPIGNGQPAPSTVVKSTRKPIGSQSLSFWTKSQIGYGDQGWRDRYWDDACAARAAFGSWQMSDDEIILSELSDDELVQQMHDDLYDGLKEEIEEGTHILLDRGWAPYRVLTEALVEGMRIVGEDFRDGILFVPEVLLSANAMKAGMAILRPLLAETGAPKQGKMVIGTVKGDIHDIGKNLVGMMMEGAGFDVIDLGINNPVEKYLAAIEEHKPDIVGMSALLTTTMPYMKVVIDTRKEKGIRDDYIVLVGGAPLNEEFGKAVGADAYCRDAAVAVETAKDFMKRKHNMRASARQPWQRRDREVAATRCQLTESSMASAVLLTSLPIPRTVFAHPASVNAETTTSKVTMRYGFMAALFLCCTMKQRYPGQRVPGRWHKERSLRLPIGCLSSAAG